MNQYGLVVFEILLAFISITIVITSSLVILRINKAQKAWSRADLIFITLSVSDIVVGMIAIPIFGSYCYFKVKHQEAPFFLRTAQVFFKEFPYFFSYFVTGLVALDRIFIVTLRQKYTDIITKNFLKGIIAVLLVLTLALASFCMFYSLTGYQIVYFAKSINLKTSIIQVLCITDSCIIISAYFVILCFVQKKTSTKKIGNLWRKKCDDRRMTKTIMLLFISQTFFVLPYILLWRIPSPNIVKMRLRPWIYLFKNCQCFMNSIMFFMYQQNSNIKKLVTEMIIIRDENTSSVQDKWLSGYVLSLGSRRRHFAWKPFRETRKTYATVFIFWWNCTIY